MARFATLRQSRHCRAWRPPDRPREWPRSPPPPHRAFRHSTGTTYPNRPDFSPHACRPLPSEQSPPTSPPVRPIAACKLLELVPRYHAALQGRIDRGHLLHQLPQRSDFFPFQRFAFRSACRHRGRLFRSPRKRPWPRHNPPPWPVLCDAFNQPRRRGFERMIRIVQPQRQRQCRQRIGVFLQPASWRRRQIRLCSPRLSSVRCNVKIDLADQIIGRGKRRWRRRPAAELSQPYRPPATSAANKRRSPKSAATASSDRRFISILPPWFIRTRLMWLARPAVSSNSEPACLSRTRPLSHRSTARRKIAPLH